MGGMDEKRMLKSEVESGLTGMRKVDSLRQRWVNNARETGASG